MNNTYSVYHQTHLDEETKSFILKWHYSKSYRSLKHKHIFKLVDNISDELIGVAIYGSPNSRHLDKQGLIELRRLCLIDETLKNSESFFISKTLKYLKNNTDYSGVISFADPNHGHTGTIYKASNFKYDGEEKNGNPRVILYGDKEIQLRQYYDKKDGEYSKQALKWQELVKQGEAEIVNRQKKLRYIYEF